MGTGRIHTASDFNNILLIIEQCKEVGYKGRTNIPFAHRLWNWCLLIGSMWERSPPSPKQLTLRTRFLPLVRVC